MTADDPRMLLERDAFEAWPAAEVEELGPWRLRFNRGVTKRANSVWPYLGLPDGPLDTAIDRVLAAYRQRDLPAIFQTSDTLGPTGLDGALGDRGWACIAPVAVQTAPVGAAPPLDAGTRLAAGMSDDWFAFSGPGGRFAGAPAATYRALLERIAGPCIFAESRVDGRIVAAGLGVAGAHGAGIFAMRTDPAHRRAGHAHAIVAGISSWAAERGAAQLYLQVEEDNDAAKALYRGLGFETRYRYQYRVEPGRDA